MTAAAEATVLGRKRRAELLANIQAAHDREHAAHLAERLALYEALDAGISWATLVRRGFISERDYFHDRWSVETGFRYWQQAGSPADVEQWTAMMY